METAPVLSGTSDFQVSRGTVDVVSKSVDDLLNAFSIRAIADQIIEGEYKIAALQFPDKLLPYSTSIAILLEEFAVGCRIYILADTSYSPCCVDEIAAQHVNADVIVHFGDSCLNSSWKIPVIYVFDSASYYDISKIDMALREKFPDKNERILLVADSQYMANIDPLAKSLTDYSNIVRSYLTVGQDFQGVIIPDSAVVRTDTLRTDTLQTDTLQTDNARDKMEYLMPNLAYDKLTDDLNQYHVFYLSSSSPSSALMLYLSTKVSSVTVLDMDSYKVFDPRVNLGRRYRLMNTARSSGTIGILVNTLSIKNVDKVLLKVQEAIRSAGKKYYTFVVGKPNVPKLANFEVVDIWVILGCPLGGIIVDSTDYYKPIITPYEMMLALKREISWGGDWRIDFNFVLSDEWDRQLREGSELVDEDDMAPAFDPISGTYVSTSQPLRRVEHIDVETEDDIKGDGQLTERFSGQLSIRGTVSTAAEYLHQKASWKGLGSDIQQDDDEERSAELEYGRAGIARGYRTDESTVS